MRKCNTLNLST